MQKYYQDIRSKIAQLKMSEKHMSLAYNFARDRCVVKINVSLLVSDPGLFTGI